MTGRKEQFQQAMNQGHSAAWDQQWEHAAEYYRQALNEFPDHAQALTSLGLALFEMQEFEESLRYYIKAARLSGNDPLPMEKIAQIYERLGKIERAQTAALQAAELYLKNKEVNKALENWNRVTRLNPENLQAHARLGLIYEHLGEKQQAVTEFLMIASLYQHANEIDKAVQAVNRALNIMPGSADAHQALNFLRDFKPLPKPSRPRGGTAPLRMAKIRQLDAPRDDQPESGLDPVAEARQRSLTVLAGLLFDSEENGTDANSRRGLQAIVRGTGNLRNPKKVDQARIVLHLTQVIDLQTQGQPEQAADELERAMDFGLEHPAAYYDLGLLRIQANQQESAVRYLQVAMKHPEYTLGSRLLLGQTFKELGRLNEAAVEYMEALGIADSSVIPAQQGEDLRQLYEPLVEYQRQENDVEGQKRVCENVSDLLMRSDWRANLTRARQRLPVQSKGGPPMPLAEVLIQSRSSQVVESLSKIYELDSAGYLRSAMEEAFYTVLYAPTYLPLHAYMAELLLKQGQMQEAINKLIIVAQTYSARGEARRAIDIYHRVIELAPMDLKPRSRLIDLLIELNKIEDALNEYMEFADVYYSQADLDMARKTYTEALRLAQQSNVDRSWRVKILHRMADIDLQSLDWRQALRIFEQIRILDPSDQDARSRLIELNFRLGQEIQALAELDNFVGYLIEGGGAETAQRFIENLIKEDPDRPSVRVRLASIYRRLGRQADAISQLDTAGEMFLDSGDREEAIRTVEMILSLNPPNVDDYQRLLAQLKK